MAETGGKLGDKGEGAVFVDGNDGGNDIAFCSRVLSLYCLTNSMMGTPCWPRAGPTGGAGVVSPAGKFNLRMILIFLAAI